MLWAGRAGGGGVSQPIRAPDMKGFPLISLENPIMRYNYRIVLQFFLFMLDDLYKRQSLEGIDESSNQKVDYKHL